MYNKRKIIQIIFLVFLSFFSSYSQEFGWKLYSEKEGVPHSQISTIFQCDDGYIWIGTYVGGLGRYSSSGWTYFKSSNEIPSNWITCIAQNKKTKEYIIGTIAGLVLLKNKPLNISRNTIIENQNITSVCFIDNQNILLGTLTGLYIFNLSDRSIKKLSSLWVTSIKQLNDDRFIIADKSGLFIYDSKTKEYFKYPIDIKSILPQNDIYGNFYINSIYCENPNHIWIGTSFNRLFEINKNRISEYTISRPVNIINKINDITKDIDGFLWIATDRGLYYLYNDNIYSVANNDLNRIYI